MDTQIISKNKWGESLAWALMIVAALSITIGVSLLQTPGMTAKILFEITFLVLNAVLCGFTFLLGCWRAGVPNPDFDKNYALWLAAGPWRPGLPLPKGSVYPTLRDAAWIAILTILMIPMAMFAAEPSLLVLGVPALLYVAGQSAVRSFASWDDDYPWPVYAALAVPPALGLVPTSFPLIVLAPLVIAPISIWGVWHRMHKFPWDLLASANQHTPVIENDYTGSDKSEKRVVGWPYQQLLGHVKEFRRPWSVALAQAGIAALWIGAATRLFLLDKSEEGLGLAYLIAVVVSGGAAVYRWLCFAPASSAGWCMGHRCATGRWFLPEYDLPRLAAPLLLLASPCIPWLAYFVLRIMGDDSSLALGLYYTFPALWAATAVLIARRAGPSIRELSLTSIQALHRG